MVLEYEATFAQHKSHSFVGKYNIQVAYGDIEPTFPYPLVMTNIAIENGHRKLVSFLDRNGGSFHSYVNVYQRLNLHFTTVFLWIFLRFSYGFSYGFPIFFQRVYQRVCCVP